METKRKTWMRRLSKHFIQYLNIGFFVSGRVMAVTAAGFSLLIFSKQLFLVKNQAAWGTVMKVAFAVALVNLFLSIPVFGRAAKLECSIPKMKGIGRYLLAEFFAIQALMVSTPIFFYIHTGGEGLISWTGDRWWVIATKMAWLISWCAALGSLLQSFIWGPIGGPKRQRQRDGSSVLTDSKEGDEISANDEIAK